MPAGVGLGVITNHVVTHHVMRPNHHRAEAGLTTVTFLPAGQCMLLHARGAI